MVSTSNKNRAKIQRGDLLRQMYSVIEKYAELIDYKAPNGISQMEISRRSGSSPESVRRVYMGTQLTFDVLEVMYQKWSEVFEGVIPEDMANFYANLEVYHKRDLNPVAA